MSDLAVTLPEPSPEDDEDVVWGLSTASALWARGERTDAVVWLRRAAEAATAAGQDFRASQLGMYATEIEDALNSATGNAPPPIAEPHGAIEETPSHASAPPLSAAESAAPPIVPSAPPTPVVSTPPPPAAKRESPWSRTLPVAPTLPTPSTPAPRVDIVEAPAMMSAPVAAAPVATSASPPPPPPAPTHAAPASAPTAGDGKPVRSQRAKPRAPILDPWSEPGTPVDQVAAPVNSVKPAAPPPPPPPRTGPSELVVEVRSRATMDSDEDVVTSAAPLESVGKKPAASPRAAAPPPPPPRSVRAPLVALPDANAPREAAPQPPAPPPPPASHPQAPAAPAPAPPIALEPDARAPGSLGAAGIAVAAKKIGPPSPIPAPKPTPTPLELPPEQRSVGGVLLEEIPALADLPHDAQAALAMAGDVQQIGADEEIAGFGAALLVEGAAGVCARVVDVRAARAQPRTLVPSRGSLADGIALRVVASEGGAKMVVWSEAIFAEALRAFPWVLDEIRDVADRLQALAGLTMGPLGDLDEGSRASTTERLTLRSLAAGEVFLERGVATPGIVVVGVGSIDLAGEDGSTRELTSGDIVFASSALDGRATAETARGGQGGALLLVADRKLTQALFAEHPQLIEIFGNA